PACGLVCRERHRRSPGCGGEPPAAWQRIASGRQYRHPTRDAAGTSGAAGRRPDRAASRQGQVLGRALAAEREIAAADVADDPVGRDVHAVDLHAERQLGIGMLMFRTELSADDGTPLLLTSVSWISWPLS